MQGLSLKDPLNASISGNAATATKLITARSINVSDAGGTHTGTAISFDGSAGGTIKLPATITATLDGNASTADKLKTPRTINGVNFDGSKDITITATDTTKIPLSGSSAITGNLIPSTNNTRDLGSSALKWANLYTTNINGQAVLSYEIVDSW